LNSRFGLQSTTANPPGVTLFAVKPSRHILFFVGVGKPCPYRLSCQVAKLVLVVTPSTFRPEVPKIADPDGLKLSGILLDKFSVEMLLGGKDEELVNFLQINEYDPFIFQSDVVSFIIETFSWWFDSARSCRSGR
jgi:hypothetical protein